MAQKVRNGERVIVILPGCLESDTYQATVLTYYKESSLYLLCLDNRSVAYAHEAWIEGV